MFADYRFFNTYGIVPLLPVWYAVFMIPDRQHVIVFGDSIFLAGLQEILGVSPDLEIICLDPSKTSLEDLHNLRPDAVIYALGSISAECFQSILQQADLLLIGIDPEINRAMFWSGQEASQLSSDLLAHVIHQTRRTGPLRKVKRGKGQSENPWQ